MIKSIELLLENNRIVSNIATVSLVLIIVSLMLAFFGGAFSSTPILVEKPIHTITACFLAMVLALSLYAMIWTTIIILRERSRLNDWGIYLVLIWVIPYFGVSICLGGANLKQLIQTKRGGG
jgi:hypothetical protein